MNTIDTHTPASFVFADIIPRMTKVMSITAIAFIITMTLFWLMSLVISQSGEPPETAGEYLAINAVFNEPETKTITRKSLPPPEQNIEPPKLPNRNLEPNDAADTMSFATGFQISAPAVETQANTSLSIGNGEARPIVRISPQYPIQAARDGVEGWVRLSFTINETGGVEDITVLDAEPKRTFNREATRALRKWKYRPKMVDGKGIKQFNMTVQLDFQLNGNN